MSDTPPDLNMCRLDLLEGKMIASYMSLDGPVTKEFTNTSQALRWMMDGTMTTMETGKKMMLAEKMTDRLRG